MARDPRNTQVESLAEMRARARRVRPVDTNDFGDRDPLEAYAQRAGLVDAARQVQPVGEYPPLPDYAGMAPPPQQGNFIDVGEYTRLQDYAGRAPRPGGVGGAGGPAAPPRRKGMLERLGIYASPTRPGESAMDASTRHIAEREARSVNDPGPIDKARAYLTDTAKAQAAAEARYASGDDVRSAAFDPAVEEAVGATGSNVNKVADFSNVQGGSRGSIGDLNARGSGLTRIVKMADGSYTDAADAVGEERMYDALGNRADRGTPAAAPGGFQQAGSGGLAPEAWSADIGAQGGDPTVAAYYAAQQATPDRQESFEGRQAMLRQGAGSLARVGTMNEETGARRQSEFLAALAPEDRAALEAASMKERGEGARAAASIASAEKIAGGRLGLDAQKAALAQQNRTDDLYMKDPVAATNLAFSKLRNKSPEEMNAFFESEEGSQMIDLATRKIQEEGGAPLYNLLARFGVVKPASQLTLNDMGQGTFSSYNVKGAEIIGPGFSGVDELGLRGDMLDEAKKYMGRKHGQLAR